MINGVLNIYKEKGYTSHDVVARLRGILGQKKIGHTGTLDPEAEGVLLVCLGNGTKLCDMLTDKSKEYIAQVRLGIVTDTQDMTGNILQENEVSVSEEEVKEAVFSFLGKGMQVPPMYSALKVNGKKLYELAREGKEVDRKARPIEIHCLEITEMNLPYVTLRVECSKGTYIRTLCHDIGEKLGCGASMAELLRTKVGEFGLQEANKLDQIEEWKKEVCLQEQIIPVDNLFEAYPACFVLDKWKKTIENGNSFLVRHLVNAEAIRMHVKETEDLHLRVYDQNQIFYGIYRYCKEEDRFVPVKMFLER